MVEQEIFNKLKIRDEKTIIDQYNTHKSPFHQFIRKYFNLDDDTIKDLYQEVWYTFYQNIKNESLLVMSSSVKTYLFQIGRNQALNVLKTMGKLTDATRNQEITELENKGKLSSGIHKQETSGLKSVFNPWEDDEQLKALSGNEDIQNVKLRLVKKVVENMTKTCKSILIPFYFEKKKLDEIFNALSGFSSKDALKTQKYKCMKSMEKLLIENFKNANLL